MEAQPPDRGWVLLPPQEFAPAELFESGRGGEAGVGKVYVRAHGPWRALWLDKVEQGLAYDFNAGKAYAEDPAFVDFKHDPSVLGFEYVRAMATAAVAAIGANALNARTRALCVGLGAGALPAFLSPSGRPGRALRGDGRRRRRRRS